MSKRWRMTSSKEAGKNFSSRTIANHSSIRVGDHSCPGLLTLRILARLGLRLLNGTGPITPPVLAYGPLEYCPASWLKDSSPSRIRK